MSSFEVDPFGDLHQHLVGERTLGIELMAAPALHSPHQLTHVSCEVVLWGMSWQTGGPATNIVSSDSDSVFSHFFTHPTREMRFRSESERVSVVWREKSWQTSLGRQWVVMVVRTRPLSAGCISSWTGAGWGATSQPLMWLYSCRPVSDIKTITSSRATSLPPSIIPFSYRLYTPGIVVQSLSVWERCWWCCHHRAAAVEVSWLVCCGLANTEHTTLQTPDTPLTFTQSSALQSSSSFPPRVGDWTLLRLNHHVSRSCILFWKINECKFNLHQ